MRLTMTVIKILMLIVLCWGVAEATNTLCAAVCTCVTDSIVTGELSLDCSKVFLTIVPPVSDWPAEVSKLDLSSNNISTLGEELSHDKLKVLDLSNNRINYTAQFAFGGLTSLEYLNLANNHIRNFEDNGFYGLDHLRSLNISSNELKTLPSDLFYNFMVLEELSLADNPIVHLEPAAFHRMPKLRWLDLHAIDAYTLPANVFHKNEELEFLDLSTNEFHKVPTDALRSARNLKHLKFNENSIDKLSRESLIKLSSLEMLELSYMDSLKTVGHNTFSSLVNLRVLEMKYNRYLYSIAPDAFDGLFDNSTNVLQEVDFEGNELKMIFHDTLKCSEMKKFNIQNNPLLCDCRMKWIKSCNIPQQYSAELRCEFPELIKGSLIVNLNEGDFVCDYSAEIQKEVHHEKIVRTVTVAAACVLLIAIASGIALVLKWRSIKLWYKSRKAGNSSVYYVRAPKHPTVI